MADKLLFEVPNFRLVFDGPSQAWLPAGAAEPSYQATDICLKILSGAEGFFLVSTSSNPSFGGGDTWHQTLEDAFAQAEADFSVAKEWWQRVAA